MKKTISLYIPPEKIECEHYFRKRIAEEIPTKEHFTYQIRKKSIDARKRPVQFLVSIDIYINEKPQEKMINFKYQDVTNAKKNVLIIGAGPAGYFAALKLIERGIKPIIFERGKNVKNRRRDLRKIQQFGKVNPNSNYCFGEGGAGTYSDGKLYTRSKKRGNIEAILHTFVQHKSDPNILIDAHPHIGSNKLPQVIENIRNTIIKYGGEIHFNAFVNNIIIDKETAIGVQINHEKKSYGDYIILATGHSARDVYELLYRKKIKLEAKEFSLGLRIEHPQALIDSIQYGTNTRPASLPASRYALSCQVDNHGVYSFCMCPGGFIVPASSSSNEQVVNGMSLSRRDSKFANSGIVTSVNAADIPEYIKKFGELAFLRFQEDIERAAFKAGGDKSQRIPAQRMIDFIENKKSVDLPETSYIPGLISYDLHALLPDFIVKRLQVGLKEFSKKIPLYLTNDAILVAVESRTSSPIKIPRNEKTLQHIEIKSLFPCGEGAGYAGGIISAAIDGDRVAEAIANNL